MSVSRRVAHSMAPIGAATPERAAHAPDGIQKEHLSHNDGHVRARVRAPMQMFGPAVNRLARKCAAATGQIRPKSGADEPSEPPYVATRLDKALDTENGGILRWALSRYVEDCILTNMRATGPESGKVDGSQADGSRIPFNETQRQALARLAFVHKHIGAADWRDLRTFVAMMVPVEGGREPPSMAQFASELTGIGDGQDRRSQEGAFVGLMWKIGERLYDIYRMPGVPGHIEMSAKAA